MRAIRRHNLVFVERHENGPRLYVLRQRVHHGATGLAIVGLCSLLRGKARRGILVGLLAMVHDRRDLRVWLAREVLPELGADTLLTSQTAGLIIDPQVERVTDHSPQVRAERSPGVQASQPQDGPRGTRLTPRPAYQSPTERSYPMQDPIPWIDQEDGS